MPPSASSTWSSETSTTFSWTSKRSCSFSFGFSSASRASSSALPKRCCSVMCRRVPKRWP